MKQFRSILSSATLILVFSACLSAQKVGYVNSQIIIAELPQVKEANTTIETLKSQLMKKGQDMVKSLQTRYQALQAKQNELSPIKLQEESEALKQEEAALGVFEQESQQRIIAKSEELLQPIQDKINAAIQAVAKEEGYTYIFDMGQGQILYADETGDVSDKVKAKLKTL